MSRIGKQAADIFQSTTGPDIEQEERRGPGRPPVHDEAYTKISVVLMDRQIVALDELTVAMRKRTGSVIRRAEIIRALVDAMMESGIDFADAISEADLKNLLVKRFRRST